MDTLLIGLGIFGLTYLFLLSLFVIYLIRKF